MATIFEDNFNAYANGNLNGQGGWAGDLDWNVQGVTVKEGAKAVDSGDVGPIDKGGNLRADGRISVYMRADNLDKESCVFQARGTPGLIWVGMGHANGKIEYYDGDDYVEITDFVVNVWYCLEIEWRDVDKKARYRIDGGAWTGWDTVHTNWVDGLDTVRLHKGIAGGHGYFDHIAEYPIFVAVPRSSGAII